MTQHLSNRRGVMRLGMLSTLTAPFTGLSGLLTPGSASARAAGSDGVRAYRRLGRTELEISDVSFGASRLRGGQESLVHHALDRGINYFDTAESYTDGASETVIGNALAGRRDGVYLASKALTGPRTRQATMMASLEASLRRLRTDYLDVFFNHAVNNVGTLENPEWLAFVETARRQGKIRFSGMSGHAGHLIECLDHALDEDMVDVILTAYNFGQDPAFYESMTRSFDLVARQPDLPRVLSKAKTRDVGVVAMKTLMGARLNDLRPFETADGTFSQAAFRWVLSNPSVDALIVSMTDGERIDEYLGASGARSVADRDLALLQRYVRESGTTYCRHACNDCEGACPFGVPIADVLRTRMYATDYGDVAFARDEYARLETSASACLSCDGQPCRSACTHGLPVADLCAPTHRMLA